MVGEINIGDTVSVEKGTEIFTQYNKHWAHYIFYNPDSIKDPEFAKRKMSVIVRDIIQDLDDTFISYGLNLGNIKYINIKNVTKIEPKSKKKKIGIVQQAIKNSEWLLTSELMAKTLYKQRGWLTIVNREECILPIGTKLKVINRAKHIHTRLANGSSTEIDYSYNIPVSLLVKNETGEEYYIERNLLNKCGHATYIPDTKIWKIINSKTGEFYKKCKSEYNNFEIQYDNNGKTFKDLGKLKIHLQMHLGLFKYDPELPYDNKPPEFLMDNGITFETIPLEWEAIQVGKITGQIYDKMTNEDLQHYANTSKKLKRLSGLYGTAVRKAYADLLKDGRLADFTGMVVFTELDDDNWGYTDIISKQQVDEIVSTIKLCFGKTTKTKRVKQHNSIAVCVKDITDAMGLKLAYEGDLTVTALDLEYLTEIVEH